MDVLYSVIVPVYNRADDLVQLLESFCSQRVIVPYEIIIVDDGSSPPCEEQINVFSRKLPVKYYYKKNTGPGDSRNFGAKKSVGHYLMFMDSDCTLPFGYLSDLESFLNQTDFDCFGGKDTVHKGFSIFQKAVNHAITSFLTTGGIRGHKAVKNFQPRSFNMGVKKSIYEDAGGFSNIHPGEDPDLVFRIKEKGGKIGFVEGLFIYHRRRINWKQFSLQMYKFGMARAVLNYWHPKNKSLTYWFPLFFSVCFLFSLLLIPFSSIMFICFSVYFLMIWLEAIFIYKSVKVAIISIPITVAQFFCYGYGFIKGMMRLRKNKSVEETLPELFFK